MNTVTIYVLAAAVLFGFSACLCQRISDWANGVEEEQRKERENYDRKSVAATISHDKLKAYEFIKKNLEKSLTGEHLTSVYQMLQAFKSKYGKCDLYCSLYSDYVAALYEFNGRERLEYTV